MKIRTIKSQLNYCITQNTRIGESKRAFKNNRDNDNIKGQVFSVQYAENLRDTANAFSAWLKDKYPEVRLANDIKSAHVQEWINEKSPQWTQSTVNNKISQMGVIFLQMGNTFGRSDTKLEVEKPAEVKAYKVRTMPMDKTDLTEIRNLLQERRTESKQALEIACRCGLRSKEIARLHSDCINLDKWVLEVREGAKNGKSRDVPIRPQDRAYFADLKAQTAGGYVCKGVTEESLNRGIRRALKDADLSDKYPNSTIHAIRKMYAGERMQEEREKGLSERQAWSIVQAELGHGNQYRQALYNVYVKS